MEILPFFGIITIVIIVLALADGVGTVRLERKARAVGRQIEEIGWLPSLILKAQPKWPFERAIMVSSGLSIFAALLIVLSTRFDPAIKQMGLIDIQYLLIRAAALGAQVSAHSIGIQLVLRGLKTLKKRE